jgi:outer membrane cobalamin receptor
VAQKPAFLFRDCSHSLIRRLAPWLLAILPLLSAAGPAGAQLTWPQPLDTIRVTAARPGWIERAASRCGSAAVIPLGGAVAADRDLGDLLDRTAGVHVHRYGGLGAFSLASVRGSSSGQVVVCLDGTPVGTSGDGTVNLALLPLASLDRAEVYRGAQTHSFGTAPAAGVINLVSPGALTAPLRLSLGMGSFGTSVAQGRWGGRSGAASMLLSGSVRQSHGDFSYLDRNGTIFANSADDRIQRRTNNDFSDASLLWKGSYTPGGFRSAAGSRADLRLDYTGQAFRRDGGVPGTESVQTRHVRLRNGRTRHDLRGRLRLLGPAAGGLDAAGGTGAAGGMNAAGGADAGRAFAEAGIYRETSSERFENRLGEVGLAAAAADTRGDDRGIHLGGGARIPLRQELRAFLDLRRESLRSTDLLRDAAGPRQVRHHRTFSLEDHAGFGPLELEGAYRWARAQDDFGQEGGARPLHLQEGATFGVRWEAAPGWVLKANRGLMARFPSFSELFGENGVQEGNPALHPERGIQWDAGVSWSAATAVRAEWTWFESLLRDRIVWLQNSQRTSKAENLERTWTRGLEASFYGQRGLPRDAGLELQSSLTWMEARDAGASPAFSGKHLPNLPGFEGYLSALLRRRRTSLRWELSLRSSSFRDRYNTASERSPASAVHDLSLEQAIRAGAWKARLTVRNLADKRIEDMDGFPLPGRTALMEVTWTL